MLTTTYTIRQFMADAKKILDTGEELANIKAAIGERMSELSKRDDLIRHAAVIGPSDAASNNYLLWREPPYFSLVMVRFDEFFSSPVHEHGDFWIVACGYRGADRWDLYERKDGGIGPGPCQVELVDQVMVHPGDHLGMPPPPRAIHSHNNVNSGDTLELVFSSNAPLPASERLLYDLSEQVARPSWYEVSKIVQGDYYPQRVAGE